MSHVPNSFELTSADREGFVKFWDIRNFSCIQTINMTSTKDLSGLSAISSTYFVCSTPGRIYLFEYKEHNETAFEEGHPISSLAYSSAAAEFLTASGSDLKI
eukprot:TRINITY_DN140_c0_g1_i10.p4 TRINITY_DN140_c0_g1~~TRINITY_DN140_c0_g1_i10.p4  ORF type:complete len:102 (-),score=19.78 TRINITY_DN140_c0_g1_i10:1181-1486(-)